MRHLALLLCLTLAACARRAPAVPPPSPAPAAVPDAHAEEERTLARIAVLEDRRSLGEGELPRLAREAPSPVVRARAFRALARLQDPATRDVLTAGLTDMAPRAREEAAFAVGELGLSWDPLPAGTKEALTRAALAREGVETDVHVRDELLVTLAKLATPEAVARLAERLDDANEQVAGRAALSLAVSARRGAKLDAAALAPRADALLTPAASVPLRYGAVYLLGQLKAPEAREGLGRCLTDPDADVRALCVKGWADVGTQEDVARLAPLLEHPAPRVAAEAARTLAKLAARCPAKGACPALTSLRTLEAAAGHIAGGAYAAGHPLLALAQQGLPRAGLPVLARLRASVQAARGPAKDVARGDLAWLDCRLAAAQDRARGTLREVLRCGAGEVPEGRRLALGFSELAQSAEAKGREATRYLDHSEARVKSAALALLTEHPDAAAAEKVRALVESEDLVIAASAAATAGALKDVAALPAVRALAAHVEKETDVAQPVADALVALAGKEAEPELRRWLTVPHANVRRVAAEALGKLTGETVVPPRVELPEGAWHPEPAPEAARLRFVTEKGTFVVALDPEAPLTSGNLWALASRGYFKGMTFHRVVPDFVAQGGDPRGDGEGGPGYSIRCELTRRPYVRGTLGMALSGKDTGGSQFFVTHTPQPHLDGRYTAFGEVVEGMDVVDALLEGDVIERVERG